MFGKLSYIKRNKSIFEIKCPLTTVARLSWSAGRTVAVAGRLAGTHSLSVNCSGKKEAGVGGS